MIHNGIERAAPAPYEDPELEELRADIDRLDCELLKLIEARLTKCAAIGKLKSEAAPEHLLIRPRREREIVDRLASRSNRLPKDAIGAIWREVMGASLQAQRKTALILHARQRPELVTSAARSRFGCLAPMIIVGSPMDALHRARTSEAIAIVELSPLSGWWACLRDDPALAIFEALSDDGVSIAALAVGRLSEGQPPDQPAPGGFEILTECMLRRRLAKGEDLQMLAFCGDLRLCRAGKGDARSEPVRNHLGVGAAR